GLPRHRVSPTGPARSRARVAMLVALEASWFPPPLLQACRSPNQAMTPAVALSELTVLPLAGGIPASVDRTPRMPFSSRLSAAPEVVALTPALSVPPTSYPMVLMAVGGGPEAGAALVWSAKGIR